MKITFLIPEIGISGGVKSTFEIANRLQKRGHDVSVLYPLIPIFDCEKWKNIGNWKYRIYKIKSNILNNDLGWFDLKSDLIKVPTFAEKHIPKADIIIATWWANAHDINRYSEDKGQKFYFIRSYETWGGPEELVDKTYNLPLIKLTNSGWLKNLIEKKFNTSILGPVFNGIDSNIFYKEKNRIKNDTKRIGFIYRRSHVKGAKDGLKTLLKIKETNKFKPVLFGDTPTKEDLKIIMQIGDVEFHKLPFKDEIRKIYNSLDIFIFPSHFEGFGNPPLEAMACGCAVASTEIGGVLDYGINDHNILVSPIKNPESLACNVIELLENEEKRKKIVNNGLKTAKKFDWDESAKNLEEIFKKYSTESFNCAVSKAKS